MLTVKEIRELAVANKINFDQDDLNVRLFEMAIRATDEFNQAAKDLADAAHKVSVKAESVETILGDGNNPSSDSEFLVAYADKFREALAEYRYKMTAAANIQYLLPRGA